MVRRATTCDAGRLEQLLRDRLPEEGRHDLESHLCVCPACRERLDRLAGGQAWWGEVRQYLGPDGAAPLPTVEVAAPRPWTEFELGFLEASENPTALGKLGGYDVLEILGRGGWGVVLKAFDPALHRLVAIKVLAEGPAANGTARKRFAREARAAAAVVHDHVVPVYAVNAEATPPYLVMAFIPGQSLQQRIDRSGPLELKEVLRIGMQTAEGLAAAHAQGLVHRDIKPANIMLENGVERVRITDFGLARAVDDASVTRTGSVAGTPQYMAPEQARGESVDQRADLFSLGSTLYAMCTGQAPFRGESGVAVIRQVSDVDPRPIRALDPEVPAWMEAIVRKLHAKDPAKRFQTAGEVAELLERCLAHVQDPCRHHLPALARELENRLPGERRGVVGRRAAATVLALATGTGLLLYALSQPKAPYTERDPVSVPDGETAEATARQLIASDNDIRERFDELRSGLSALHQGMTCETTADQRVEPGALLEIARRTGRLQREMTSPTDADGDPIESEMATIRARLNVLRKQIGFDSK